MLRRLTACALLLAAMLLSTAESRADERGRRAMWVVRYSLASAGSIDRMVRQAAEAGFDDLFVQVCGRGDAWFPSSVYPHSGAAREVLASGFDPLAYVLERAHARGIRVHAWVNTLLVWSAADPPEDPSHVYNTRPEWMMVDRRGKSLADYTRGEFKRLRITGAFLSPAHPGAREYVRSFIAEIVGRYPVDGVHLDYIRYPLRDTDYGAHARRGFHAAHKVDPQELVSDEAGSRREYGDRRYGELLRLWREVRAGYVSGLVANIRSTVDSLRPGTVLSAAVKPDIDSAVEYFGQDWPGWVRRGYVDMVLPMAYSTDADKVYSQISSACSAVGADKVWAGLRAWETSVSGTMKRVRRIAPLDTGGICFFSYDGVKDNGRFFDAVRAIDRGQ